jgi:alpha-D-ribose 1-methylphosphonate 5-triphosphate synthase subunit PhnG
MQRENPGHGHLGGHSHQIGWANALLDRQAQQERHSDKAKSRTRWSLAQQNVNN